MDGHASSRLGASCPTQVFHSNRHTVQRPQDVPSANGLVCRLSVCQRVIGHDGGIALQAAIELLDAFELGLGGLDRGNLARLNLLGNFQQFSEMCFVLAHGNPLMVSPIVRDGGGICP